MKSGLRINHHLVSVLKIVTYALSDIFILVKEVKDGLGILKSYDSTLDLKSSAQSIISNIKSSLDEDPWFMRALDDVARLHPFVSVAVIAFKACYNMEMARRQNDKRVIALFREMKDMIEVLTRSVELSVRRNTVPRSLPYFSTD
jgi:hypothetical protein